MSKYKRSALIGSLLAIAVVSAACGSSTPNSPVALDTLDAMEEQALPLNVASVGRSLDPEGILVITPADLDVNNDFFVAVGGFKPGFHFNISDLVATGQLLEGWPSTGDSRLTIGYNSRQNQTIITIRANGNRVRIRLRGGDFRGQIAFSNFIFDDSTVLPPPASVPNQMVSPGYFNGNGIANQNFQVGRSADDTIEVGLNAKQRFPMPANAEPSDNGVYTFDAGTPDGNFSFLESNDPNLQSSWNFDWSINVGEGVPLNTYRYELRIQYDPSDDSDNGFVIFDPINPSTEIPFFDHAIAAFNSTAQNQGDSGVFKATSPTEYDNFISDSSLNVAQNSYNTFFFRNLATAKGLTFDARTVGMYTISLRVFGGSSNNVLLAESSIIVDQVQSSNL